MATYAVLGSTGTVGGSVIEELLKSPARHIYAYARSTKKLFTLHPDWEKSPNLDAYEGTLQDIETLADCISGTKAVFMCAATAENQPGCDVARQQAKSVVKALDELRIREPQAQLPQLVVLSSSTLEPHLTRDLPALFHWLLVRAGSHIYADLELAEQFLRSRDDIKQVYIKPGGLVQDIPHGHQLSTERQQTFLSFVDLAAGMVEVAEAGDQYDLKNISVIPATEGTRIEWGVPYYLFKGLLIHWLPGLYPYISNWLP
ncbi:uncharacterized protein LTR77_003495 [Saxophila tyrrhenica]|uniref:NAD(P)-binding domain-containing protein n=1 Tax=Saxophila tyrrhenica TaxID=1690608 RepID=A0AAV9PEJ4_9PEZI|nr:hypothetical protein LTR77_003495 [Saxophila tyrrhenica]